MITCYFTTIQRSSVFETANPRLARERERERGRERQEEKGSRIFLGNDSSIAATFFAQKSNFYYRTLQSIFQNPAGWKAICAVAVTGGVGGGALSAP